MRYMPSRASELRIPSDEELAKFIKHYPNELDTLLILADQNPEITLRIMIAEPNTMGVVIEQVATETIWLPVESLEDSVQSIPDAPNGDCAVTIPQQEVEAMQYHAAMRPEFVVFLLTGILLSVALSGGDVI